MGKETNISWTDSTFNTHWGCVEVSAECDHCYARELAKRFGFAVWGKGAPRRFFPDAHWNDLVKWDAAAAQTGTPWRVFWDSMSDLMEERKDLEAIRGKAAEFMLRCIHLTHLLLTKRPDGYPRFFRRYFSGVVPDNIWPGVTVGIPSSGWRVGPLDLLGAKTTWVSAEPLIGPVEVVPGPKWYVVGGESGPKCRPMDLEWARRIRDGCRKTGAAFFMKQVGGWPHKKDRLEDFPGDLRIREYPGESGNGR